MDSEKQCRENQFASARMDRDASRGKRLPEGQGDEGRPGGIRW